MQDRFKFRVWLKELIKPRMTYTSGLSINKNQIDDSDNIVMQCTGLKDKNGNLIFEGDILKTKEGLAKVEYYHAEFVLVLIQNPDYSFVDWDTTEQAVIGNIYENNSY